MSETGQEIQAGLNELHIARLFKCAREGRRYGSGSA
jgi:hypothetical protein